MFPPLTPGRVVFGVPIILRLDLTSDRGVHSPVVIRVTCRGTRPYCRLHVRPVLVCCASWDVMSSPRVEGRGPVKPPNEVRETSVHNTTRYLLFSCLDFQLCRGKIRTETVISWDSKIQRFKVKWQVLCLYCHVSRLFAEGSENFKR